MPDQAVVGRYLETQIVEPCVENVIEGRSAVLLVGGEPVTVGNCGGVAILETDDLSAIHHMTSTFAVFDFRVEPVLDVADAMAAEASAVQWRSSIGS